MVSKYIYEIKKMIRNSLYALDRIKSETAILDKEDVFINGYLFVCWVIRLILKSS